MRTIGIFSLEADLHAHAVKHELELLGGRVHFFASDSQIEDGGITWELGQVERSIMRDYDGKAVPIPELDVAWWRRVNQPQKNAAKFDSAKAFELVNNEWKSAIFGLVSDSFSGVWVNHPASDSLAGNKIFHLKKAQEVGLRVPRTLVTNNHLEVEKLYHECNGDIIAKKIIGAAGLSLATIRLSEKELFEAQESIRPAPAMYQERILSGRHVRANCFGDVVTSVLIESNDLDWRRNLNCEFSPYDLGSELNGRLTELLRKLGLKMGIMDLIVTDNEVVWLEINPQGQFLFAEGLSGVNIKRTCAEFLMRVEHVQG